MATFFRYPLNNVTFLSLVFLISLSCNTTKTSTNSQLPAGFVPFSDSRISYEGRIGNYRGQAAELYWPGSAVRVRFSGTGVRVLLEDYNGQNFFNVVVDGSHIRKIRVDSARRWYVLTENLEDREHIIELWKATQVNQEYNRGYIRVYGFHPMDGRILSPPVPKKRRIEFYGNSITCGHAVEDTSGKDSGASLFENNYFAYGAITARHFEAQYSCIAVSGIGLLAGFRKLIMPEMYDLRNPFDSSDHWNFSLFTPDIVVVNLLQNDEAVIGRPDSEAFKKRFGTTAPTDGFIVESYKKFISKLRGHYRKAHIICVLGNMGITREGSKWPGLVQEATSQMHDNKVHHYFFRFKGTPGHPNIIEQKKAADSLIQFISANQLWD